MITLRIEELVKEKGISKVQFADMMHIKKQNVNVLLQTSNITKLQEIADVLQVKLTDLWLDDTLENNVLNGYVEYKGIIYTVKTVEDLSNLTALVQQDISI